MVLLLLALSRALAAEEPAAAARSTAARFTPHDIQDNSFLIEESYNQEEGAFPIGVGPSRGSRQVLLYLSLEHPFQRAR